jgi:hypothetical protein
VGTYPMVFNAILNFSHLAHAPAPPSKQPGQ